MEEMDRKNQDLPPIHCIKRARGERGYKTIVAMDKIMLYESGLPQNLCAVLFKRQALIIQWTFPVY